MMVALDLESVQCVRSDVHLWLCSGQRGFCMFDKTQVQAKVKSWAYVCLLITPRLLLLPSDCCACVWVCVVSDTRRRCAPTLVATTKTKLAWSRRWSRTDRSGPSLPDPLCEHPHSPFDDSLLASAGEQVSVCLNAGAWQDYVSGVMDGKHNAFGACFRLPNARSSLHTMCCLCCRSHVRWTRFVGP
jgi:hypothetical protein